MEYKVVNGLFSDQLSKSINDMLDDFILTDSSEEEMYHELKFINESIRLGLYILSMEKGFVYLSQRINNVNNRINEERTSEFIKAVENNQADKFLSTLGKLDKICLLNHLGINAPLDKSKGLSKKELDYYKIINDSIKNSQGYDKRNGLDIFLKHKKDKA